MSKIFLSGDCHGFEFDRFSYKTNPWLRDLTEDDFVIIGGDYGLPWNSSTKRYDEYWLKWFSEKPFTLLVVLGNHDNYPMIRQLPVKLYKFDSTEYSYRVNPDYPNVRYITRPQFCYINNQAFLMVPGADSHDKFRRTEKIDWWPEEAIDEERALEISQAIFDSEEESPIVVSHDVPSWYLDYGVGGGPRFKPTSGENCLERIRQQLRPKYWFCGHLHQEACLYDKRLDSWTIECYHNIIDLDDIKTYTKEHLYNFMEV